MLFTDSETTNVAEDGPPRSDSHKKRVLLVDDHAVVRAGLSRLLNQTSQLVACGEAYDERSALDAVRQLQPDVAVVDWSLGNKDSADLIAAMRQDHPETPVLVLSMHEELFYAERALQAGASGYVMKREAVNRIVEAILSVADGIPYFSERVAQEVKSPESTWKSQCAPTPSQQAGEAKQDKIPNQASPPASSATLFVSVVIPVYNGEKTIRRLVELLVRELGRAYRLQIVLVDDGSQDQSALICRELHDRHPDLIDFVMLAKNFGEHNAVMAGLNCAEGDYCVVMDDDFQNPPSEVHKLIEEIRKGHDVVYVHYETKYHSLFRNLGSRVHNWMATHALGKPRDLYLSSFKAISRLVVREVVHYNGPAPYLDAIILRTTRKIGVVTARHQAGQKERSGYTFSKLISLWGNMLVAFSLYPVRLLGLYGLIALLIGSGYGIYTLVAWLSPGIADPGPLERLNASLWFFRGVQSICLAIVAEYVGRIYMQLSRDPQFIIRSILRHKPRG